MQAISRCMRGGFYLRRSLCFQGNDRFTRFAMKGTVSDNMSQLMTTLSSNQGGTLSREKFGGSVETDPVKKKEISSQVRGTPRYVIRRGRIEDCSQIYALMGKLAQSENYTKKFTEEDLRRDGFGDRPAFESIVLADREANNEDAIFGYVVYFDGYCSMMGRLLFGESVYIDPEHRSTGVGVALMQAVAKVSKDRGCNAVQGIVVEWKTEVIELYKGIGFRDITLLEKYHLFQIDQFDVNRFAEAKIPALNNASQLVTFDL